MEGQPLPSWESSLLVLLTVGVVSGTVSLCLLRGPGRASGSTTGRWLCVAALLALGLGNLLSLKFGHGLLLPFGLSAGGLVMALMWEDPFGGWLSHL